MCTDWPRGCEGVGQILVADPGKAGRRLEDSVHVLLLLSTILRRLLAEDELRGQQRPLILLNLQTLGGPSPVRADQRLDGP